MKVLNGFELVNDATEVVELVYHLVFLFFVAHVALVHFLEHLVVLEVHTVLLALTLLGENDFAHEDFFLFEDLVDIGEVKRVFESVGVHHLLIETLAIDSFRTVEPLLLLGYLIFKLDHCVLLPDTIQLITLKLQFKVL